MHSTEKMPDRFLVVEVQPMMVEDKTGRAWCKMVVEVQAEVELKPVLQPELLS